MLFRSSAVLETNFQMADYLKSAREIATESGITGSGSALILCGVSPEGERRLGRRYPEASLHRVATVGRADYTHRTSQGGGPEWKSPR